MEKIKKFDTAEEANKAEIIDAAQEAGIDQNNSLWLQCSDRLKWEIIKRINHQSMMNRVTHRSDAVERLETTISVVIDNFGKEKGKWKSEDDSWYNLPVEQKIDDLKDFKF